jgi:DEAD/DEAH box helicase domain-containing protein
LITFTDSRQGTARISTKIQQDSERDSIRGLIYGVTAQNVSALSKVEQKALEDKLEEYQYKAEKFRGHGELDLVKSIDELAEPIRQQLNSVGSAKLLHWNAALNNLYSSPDISRWIFDYYKKLNPVLFPDNGGARILTEMLLLREFARRPKRQNSMETLGLVAVRYPALSEIKRAPVVWLELGLDLPEWVAYLKVILDFFIRENSIINIPIDWVDWMGAKIYPKSVLGPNSDESTSSRIKAWPKINRGRNGRIVRMLVVACDLELENKVHRDSVTGVLKEAWIALTAKYQVKDDETNQTEIRQILKSLPGTVQFHLDRAEMSFGACACGWVCPITNRLVDSTFKGITPYLPYNLSEQKIICRKVTIPIYQINASEFESDLARKIAIRDWVSEQAEISELRSENLWTDISDKILEGGKFFRTAEHSAQQPASKLERYEAMFKVGKLNVLNCSTTMEMGVDIGGISVVAMNNVPPHPANYLQRSGRAGRRGETQALSFTICKDNPHERQVFVNPLWPFTTSIDAPYITLNSERIVQRHVNSLFLAYFLKEILTVNEKSLTSLNCQWFFYHDDISQAPVERFERWLASLSHEYIPVNLKEGIERIVKGSVLSSLSIVQIISRSIDSVDVAKNQWLPGYRKLKDELSKASSLKESDPFRRKVEYDLKCMGEGYLLSELASKAFLPGYGFPTGIATFDHFSVDDYKRGKYRKASGRIDNLTRMRERPGRDMAVAIREYAPGADVVLDGLVYRSAGILLNKFSPSEDYSVPQKMTVEWRCDSCGFIGNESGATFSNHCSECGASLSEDHVKDYLEPIGFAVDFYSSPSTDISSQMYVPTQEPWVTANDTLNPLFDPRLGSYRNSPKGHIFNHSSGAFGNGFAVCLRCGKADSMTNDNEYPFGLQPGKPHKKLQGKPGPEETAMCEGPEEAYAIKSGVHLGSTDQTDVYELYLKYPEENLYIRHQKGDSLPWTLAVVLRQVLADIHGIDASEMGYTIKPSRLQGCGYPVATIVLFDKCGGGAGFSTAAPRYLRDMFIRALAYLECAEDCDSACQSCLMGYDTRFHIDLLNRHSAIKYIETILPFLDLPLNAKLFGEDSKYCNEPLSSEIIASSTSGHTQLRIFTGASYADWNINNGSMKESCLSWRNMFDEVELVLPGNHVNELSDIHKEDLKALSNFGIKLTVLSGGVSLPSSTGCLLAQVIIGKKVISYAWTQSSINIPDSNWWDFEEGYLVKSDSFQEVGVVEFDEKHLSTVKGDGDIEIDLSSQCDGLINQFGEKFWDHISEKSETLLTIFNSDLSLQKLEYSDCYICTPWSLMLLAEIIDGLKQRLEGKWSHPEIALNTSEKNNPRKGSGVYGEWASKQDTGTVIAHYFEQMDEQINVNLKPFKDIPHGRILSLYWGNGSTSTIRLDHGVGCWSMDGHASKWLDVQGSAESQVSDMFDLLPSIRVRYSKNFPTQIFIKNR